MSADENGTEIEQARAARRRAQEMLAKVEAQRPEIKDLSDRATRLSVQNNFGILLTRTIQGSA